MNPSTPLIDPCLCPLCGQANACAMASTAPGAALPAEPCWCTRVHFADDLLQQVPEAARQKACICARCAAAANGAAAAANVPTPPNA